MKKHLIAVAALSAMSGAVFAQSSVTLYGALDVSVAYGKNVSGSKSATYVNDSAIQSSLWGLKGTEDLGGGLKANFNLQGDVAMDTGALPTSGEIFRREANVSLVSADMGELRIGRTLSPAYVNSQGGVILPGNSIGVSTALATGYAADIFTKNAVTYYSPSMSGVKATVQYAFGERADGTKAANANRKAAASVVYTDGGLRAGVGAEEVLGNDAKTTRRYYNANAQYALGDLKFGGGLYWVHKGGSTVSTANAGDVTQVQNSSHGFILSAGYQVDQGLIVGATYVDNSLDSSLLNFTARQALSKRTVLYAIAALADNGNKGVKFTPLFSNISNSASGVGADRKAGALALGVIHAF
jgi:predicted porin